MKKISQKIVKDIKKPRFRSRSRVFCQFLEGFGELSLEKKSQFWFRKIWSRKKSIGVSFGEFGLGKKYGFRFRRIWLGKKVSVSENLVSEKKSRLSISVSVNILVSSFSDYKGYGHIHANEMNIPIINVFTLRIRLCKISTTSL